MEGSSQPGDVVGPTSVRQQNAIRSGVSLVGWYLPHFQMFTGFIKYFAGIA